MGWAIACSAVARPAIAQEAPALSWDAPGACPSASWVQARAGRYLGRKLEPTSQPALSIAVEIGSLPNGSLEARLVIDSEAGHRVRALRDMDCVLLADAIAFIVARAIDPAAEPKPVALTAEERATAQASSPDSSPNAATPAPAASGALEQNAADGGSPATSASEADASTDEPKSKPVPITIEDPEVRPPPPVPLRVGWALGVQGALAWQPLPELAPGVLAHGAMRLGDALRIELGVGYYPRHGRALSTDPGAVAYFDALLGALSVCAVARADTSELGLCLGASVGVVRGDAALLSDGRDSSLPWSALTLGPMLMQPLAGAWALRFALLPQLALVRPRFVLDSGEAIYSAERFGFLGSIGVELKID